jgi:DNA-binding NarL/FixJ family response regulator
MANILLVEDEVSVRLALELQLSAHGEVYAADDREEWEELRQELLRTDTPLDLAVIDLCLPGVAGFDFDAGFAIIEQVGREHGNPPVIVITVRNDKDAWDRALGCPAVHYFVTKGWRADELKEAVTRSLAGDAVGLTLRGQIEGVDENLTYGR